MLESSWGVVVEGWSEVGREEVVEAVEGRRGRAMLGVCEEALSMRWMVVTLSCCVRR